MRPDVVIKYPDNRSVIIDSKVSLNAFTQYLSSSDKDEQERELQLHVTAIKKSYSYIKHKRLWRLR